MQRIHGVKPFSFYTGKSFSLHIGIIIFCVIFSAWQFNRKEEQRKANIKLVQSSVRVDVVAMPKKTFQELKALQTVQPETEAAKPEPVVEAKAPETPDTGKEFIKEKEKTSFADLMKKYSKEKVEDAKPKKKSNEQAKEKKFDGKSLAKLQGLIKRGNKVQAGQALVGSGSAGDLTVLQEYASNLPNKVKPYWKLPSYLADQNLKCRIQVFINSQGRLLKAKVYETSDSPEYDQRALNAVMKAAPFPTPPDSVATMTMRGDILLGFPL